MQSTLIFVTFAALAQAGLVPLLPPFLPPLSVRDAPRNSTITMAAPFGLNSTQSNLGPDVHYLDTVAWKVYIAFLVLGILTAALMLPVVYSTDLLSWYRSRRAEKQNKQREIDVKVAKAKMREMLQQPEHAHLRAERYG